MAWIEVHQSLPTHRKLMKLKRLIKKQKADEANAALGALVRLWLWALDNAPDGDLSNIDADDIADAAGMSEGEAFTTALIEAGWLDDDMRLHDWDDYAGRLIAMRETRAEANRTRQQRCRENKRNAPVTRDKSVTERDSNAMSRVTACDKKDGVTPCHATTVPNQTIPNSTIPSLSPKPSQTGGAERERKTPSVSEVQDAIKQFGIEADAVRFVAEMEAQGWTDSGGNPIRDWRIYLKGWAARDRAARGFGGKTPTSMQYAQRPYDPADFDALNDRWLAEMERMDDEGVTDDVAETGERDSAAGRDDG